MDREHIRKQLIDILSSPGFAALEFNPAMLTDDASLLNDVGLDSIQLLEFIVAIENAFQFTANPSTLNVEIFDRWTRVIDFVEAGLAERRVATNG